MVTKDQISCEKLFKEALHVPPFLILIRVQSDSKVATLGCLCVSSEKVYDEYTQDENFILDQYPYDDNNFVFYSEVKRFKIGR